VYNPDEGHMRAVFAGGYPGWARAEAFWPQDRRNGTPYLPEADEREADQMARPLTGLLLAQGYGVDAIDELIRRQGDSSNSLDDIVQSVRAGHLDPNRYHTADRHGLVVVAGKEHAKRFVQTLALALDMDPRRIIRASLVDPYGTPATEFMPAESERVARLKERAALVFHRAALQGVKPGDTEGLATAEQRFREMVDSPAGFALRHPLALGRAALLG
jgi:hypothetical protein